MSEHFKSFTHGEYLIELIPDWEWTEHYGNELDCYDDLSEENRKMMYEGYTRRLQFFKERDKGAYYVWFSSDGGETGYRAGYLLHNNGKDVEVDIRLGMMSCGVKFKEEKTLEEAAKFVVDGHLAWEKEEEERRLGLKDGKIRL